MDTQMEKAEETKTLHVIRILCRRMNKHMAEWR